MSEIEKSAPRELDRRTILKGAAWSAPVIAAAVATPLAAASPNPAPSLRVYGDCLLSAAGITIGQGFYVENSGDAAYEGTITLTERIELSGAAAVPGVSGIIFGLMLVQGILGGNTRGVTRSSWNRQLFSNVATRTVTLSAPMAAGETRSWGLAANVVSGIVDTLGLVGLAGISHTATITSPTGNPPVTKSTDELNYRLLDGSC